MSLPCRKLFLAPQLLGCFLEQNRRAVELLAGFSSDVRLGAGPMSKFITQRQCTDQQSQQRRRNRLITLQREPRSAAELFAITGDDCGGNAANNLRSASSIDQPEDRRSVRFS